MEFRFNLNEIFNDNVVEVDSSLIPPGFQGDKRALWDTQAKIAQIVNAMGEASARAQGLTKTITTSDRLRNSEHKLYLLLDRDSNNGKGAVTGMLKMGEKSLYVFDRQGQHYKVSPCCVLDFYVHESRQRSGLGRKLFEYMLQQRNSEPEKLAIDRPSDKFLGFLKKHYGLDMPIKQMNNYVVFDGFFPKMQEDSARQYNRSSEGDSEPLQAAGKRSSANGLQNFQGSPYGRHAAYKPTCSMGQIIHNDTAVVRNAESTGPKDYQPQPENPQAIPNVTYQNQTQPQSIPEPKYVSQNQNSQNMIQNETNIGSQYPQSQSIQYPQQTFQNQLNHVQNPAQMNYQVVNQTHHQPLVKADSMQRQDDAMVQKYEQNTQSQDIQGHAYKTQSQQPQFQGQYLQNQGDFVQTPPSAISQHYAPQAQDQHLQNQGDYHYNHVQTGKEPLLPQPTQNQSGDHHYNHLQTGQQPLLPQPAKYMAQTQPHSTQSVVNHNSTSLNIPQTSQSMPNQTYYVQNPQSHQVHQNQSPGQKVHPTNSIIPPSPSQNIQNQPNYQEYQVQNQSQSQPQVQDINNQNSPPYQNVQSQLNQQELQPQDQKSYVQYMKHQNQLYQSQNTPPQPQSSQAQSQILTNVSHTQEFQPQPNIYNQPIPRTQEVQNLVSQNPSIPQQTEVQFQPKVCYQSIPQNQEGQSFQQPPAHVQNTNYQNQVYQTQNTQPQASLVQVQEQPTVYYQLIPQNQELQSTVVPQQIFNRQPQASLVQVQKQPTAYYQPIPQNQELQNTVVPQQSLNTQPQAPMVQVQEQPTVYYQPIPQNQEVQSPVVPQQSLQPQNQDMPAVALQNKALHNHEVQSNWVPQQNPLLQNPVSPQQNYVAQHNLEPLQQQQVTVAAGKEPRSARNKANSAGDAPQMYKPLNGMQSISNIPKNQEPSKSVPNVASSNNGTEVNDLRCASVFPINSAGVVGQNTHQAAGHGGQKSIFSMPTGRQRMSRVTAGLDINQKTKNATRILNMNANNDMQAFAKNSGNSNVKQFDISKGYPPQARQERSETENDTSTNHKAERPQSLEIQPIDDQNGAADNDDLNSENPSNHANDEIEEHDEEILKIEKDFEKTSVSPRGSTPGSVAKSPNYADAAGMASSGRNTPPGLTEKGYYDLKFYHNKLW